MIQQINDVLMCVSAVLMEDSSVLLMFTLTRPWDNRHDVFLWLPSLFLTLFSGLWFFRPRVRRNMKRYLHSYIKMLCKIHSELNSLDYRLIYDCTFFLRTSFIFLHSGFAPSTTFPDRFIWPTILRYGLKSAFSYLHRL